MILGVGNLTIKYLLGVFQQLLKINCWNSMCKYIFDGYVITIKYGEQWWTVVD